MSSANDLATRNGFPPGGLIGVAVNLIAPSGSDLYSQVQVVVSQQMVPLISGMFVSDPTTIGARATARQRRSRPSGRPVPSHYPAT